ncbi:hypothetical protein SEVIR_4G007404v4 [Setaria viridis]
MELFSQAQRNILSLNKQRLLAMEELKKLQDENKSLLQEIEVLETEVQGAFPFFSMELVRCPSRSSAIINILELDPISSCGSLSTYVASVSCAVQGKGNLVEVILPNYHVAQIRYTSINMDGIHGLRKAEAEYESYFGGIWHKNRIWTGTSSGVGLILIEPVQLSYFNHDMLRGYPDDFERFSYFSHASLDYIVKSGKQPDILHIHNWETAIVAPLFWDIFAHQVNHSARGVSNSQEYTIHDLCCHFIHMVCNFLNLASNAPLNEVLIVYHELPHECSHFQWEFNLSCLAMIVALQL